MKKYLLGLVVVLGLVGVVKAGDWWKAIDAVEPIQVSTETLANKLIAYIPSITLEAPGVGNRNCLSEISVTSNNPLRLSIYDGPIGSGTTLYTVIMSSGVPFYDPWEPVSPLCGNINSTMTVFGTLYLSNSVTTQINLSGFKRNR